VFVGPYHGQRPGAELPYHEAEPFIRREQPAPDGTG
jgi:hypothetical protein